MDVRIPLELDAECWQCHGIGVPSQDIKNPFVDDNGSCSMCDGKGYIVTDFGNAVLSFFDRHRGAK